MAHRHQPVSPVRLACCGLEVVAALLGDPLHDVAHHALVLRREVGAPLAEDPQHLLAGRGADAALGAGSPDRDAAVATAHEQFRWFAGGWKVNAELPGTSGFAAATQFVRPDDVAEAIPCGPDVAAHVEAVRPFVDAR